MSITKKAISVGLSAALLASLAATVVAPAAALADYSVANTVAVPVGGTSSGTALSLTFNDASTWSSGLSGGGFCTATSGGTVSATLTYTIKDYAGNSTLSFVGTPTITAPSSLGASVALAQTNVANDSFTVTITGCDPNNVEQFTVGGLQIAASGSAAPGQIQAALSGSSAFMLAITGATTTAKGTLQSIILNSYVTVNTTSTCGFVPSGNTATFGTQTGVSIYAVNGTVPGLQSIFLNGSGLTGAHTIGETVTQTVPVCSVILSPGTVGAVATQTATQSAANQQQVNPGEQNQPAGTTSLAEPSAGFLAAGTTIKFALSAPGVLFSHAPTVTVTTGTGLSAPTGLTATAANPSGTLAAGTYYYEVTALIGTGETTASAEASATLSGTGSINVQWGAVAGATSYRVYRGTTSGGENTYYTVTAPTTSFNDTGAAGTGGTPPGSNTATISAPTGLSGSVSSTGGTLTAADSPRYYAVTALTQGDMTGAHQTTGSAPASVTITSGSTNSVNLSWTPVTGATGYVIYEASSAAGLTTAGTPQYWIQTGTTFTDTGAAGTASGSIPATNVTATIPAPSGVLATATANSGGLAAGTYYYVVTATNAAGQTMKSNEAHAAVLAGGSINLSWTAVTGATGYNIYRGTASGAEVLLASGNSTTTFADNGSATPGTATPPSSNGTAGTAITPTSSLCSLSFDRTYCTFTTSTASAGLPSTITLSSIELDVASTVANGTAVNVNLTVTPAVTVSVSSQTIAYVARALAAVSVQAVPTVNINYNAQQTGVITVTESAAGFFQAGSSGNNQLSLCVSDNSGETFTFAPWAIVTPTTAGGLLLLNPATNLGVTSVAGTLNSSATCATWTVYSASTVASTVTIVGANASGALSVSTPTNGPTINVPASATPGPVQFTVASGTSSTTVFSTQVTNAVRAFKSGVTVTAGTPAPYIAPGTSGTGSNLTISETLNGQLVSGEQITCRIVPSGANPLQTQAMFATANQNQLPVVSTNTASGLLAHLAGTTSTSFTIAVDQQAFAPNLGTITISNINYTVVNGATTGPVVIECSNQAFTGLAGTYGFVSASAAPEGQNSSTAAFGPGNVCLATTAYSYSYPPSFGYGQAILDMGNPNQETVNLQPGSVNACPSGDFAATLVYAHSAGASLFQAQPGGGNYSYMNGVDFDAFVSNAIVGTAPVAQKVVISAYGSGGTMYSSSSQVLAKGQKLTVTFRTNPQLAGQRLGIWLEVRARGATKFGPLKPHTSIVLDVNGVGTYTYSASSGVKIGLVGKFVGNATQAPANSYPTIFGFFR